jgi:hypothetical protein
MSVNTSVGKKLALTFGFFAACLALAKGADWLAVRGDGQRTGWQANENRLTPKTVKGMRLLWKRQLGVVETWSSPLLMGPIITHRGIKELVLVASSSGRVSAVDADLGTVFWTKDLPTAPPERNCPSTPPMTPTVLSSVIAELPAVDPNPDDEVFSDGNRPVLVATGDGMVHSLRVSTGEEITLAKRLTEHRPVFIAGFDDTLYGAGADSCDQWPKGVMVMRSGQAAPIAGTTTGEDIEGFAVGLRGGASPNEGADGSVPPRAPVRQTDGVATRKREFADSNISVFPWRGREMTAVVKAGLILVNGDAVRQEPLPSNPQVRRTDREPSDKWLAVGGLGTWVNKAGERWLCAIETNGHSYRLQAFRMVERKGEAALTPIWRSAEFRNGGAPVVAAGVIYFLGSAMQDGPDQLKLFALEASGGAPLFSTSEGLVSGMSASGLGLANGHVCFTTTDGVLNCFGLPIEI